MTKKKKESTKQKVDNAAVAISFLEEKKEQGVLGSPEGH